MLSHLIHRLVITLTASATYSYQQQTLPNKPRIKKQNKQLKNIWTSEMLLSDPLILLIKFKRYWNTSQTFCNVPCSVDGSNYVKSEFLVTKPRES